MARSEVEMRGADEAILVNTNGEITEGSTSNIFWIREGTVCTPPIQVGALPGITRAVVAELCASLKIPFAEQTISPAQLREVGGVFVTVTTRGVVEAMSLDGVPLARSSVVAMLRDAYEKLLARESVDT
jgi:branched-subunit amino acid aminotransferase/4-amino-4-deoxychorismate lyase